MLQASIYADRHADDTISGAALERGRCVLSGFALRALSAIAHRVVDGANPIPLDDHLLRDIGLTRADVEAMR